MTNVHEAPVSVLRRALRIVGIHVAGNASRATCRQRLDAWFGPEDFSRFAKPKRFARALEIAARLTQEGH